MNLLHDFRTYTGANHFAPRSAPVTNLFTRVGDIPAIKDWIKRRPETA